MRALHIDPIVEFAERIESLVETRGAINKAALDLTRLQDITRNGVDSYYGFTKMLWLKNNKPDIWKRTHSDGIR